MHVLGLMFTSEQYKGDFESESCYICLLGPMNINFCLGQGWAH